MNVMTNGYKNKMRKLSEHTDVYLYEEQWEDHQTGSNVEAAGVVSMNGS